MVSRVAQAIGGSLVFAIGFAVTSLPIAVIVLVPLSKGDRVLRTAFACGWSVGAAGAMAIVIAVSDAIGAGSDTSPATWVLMAKILFGAALLVLAGWEWRKRPAPGDAAHVPGWMRLVENISPLGSAGLGLAIAAANPKNLLMIVAGGLAIAESPLSTGGEVIAAAVFVILAVMPVVMLFALYRYLGRRAQRWLDVLTDWIELNNAAVMAVLLLVIGTALLGNGIAGL